MEQPPAREAAAQLLPDGAAVSSSPEAVHQQLEIQPHDEAPPRRPASVTFAEGAEGGWGGPAKPKMRYARLAQGLLHSLTGGSSAQDDAAAAEAVRRAFNPDACPARPAMKRGTAPPPLYPAVADLEPGAAPNPPGSYPMHGGAALASALGVGGDDAAAGAIPAPCPPALPRTPSPGLGEGAAAGGLRGGGPAANPLAVADMPVAAPPTRQPPTATTPAALATADVTVQLCTAGSGGSVGKLQALPPSAADLAAAADQHAPGGWQHLADAAGAGGACKDVEAAEGEDEVHAHFMGLQQRSHGSSSAPECHDDDNASSGLIIPPGQQQPLPPFWSQLSGRALFVGLLVGIGLLLLTMRLALATGLAPNLQVVAAAACWALLRGYTFLLGRDMACIPALSAQEVAVAAAAALGVAGTAAAGGFGGLVLALTDPVVQRVGDGVPGNLPSVVWSLAYGRLAAYCLLVALAGALLMLTFRKSLFAAPSLTFATGAATGQLISVLHTPPASYHGGKQKNRFTQWSVISFMFAGYQWIFNNPGCNGFRRFPTLGLQALAYTWSFDFQLAFCGLGIMAPAGVAWSLVVGAVVSWGLLWPVLSSREGSWFPAGLSATDVRGAYGYHLVVALALLLGDALYHAGRAAVIAGIAWHNPDAAADAPAAPSAEAMSGAAEPPGPGMRRRRRRNKQAWRREALRILETDTLSDASGLQFSMASMERALRQHIFQSDGAASWAGVVGFVLCIAAAIGALPALFSVANGAPAGGAVLAEARGLEPQHVAVAAVLAAVAAYANARGGGIVNIDLSQQWARLGVVLFSAWAGANAGSAGAGLLCGGLLMGAASSALSAMYAWRAAYMTMASPTAVFIAHMLGLGVGCFAAPAAWLLYDAATAPAAPGAAAAAGSSLGLLSSDGYFASPVAALARASAALSASGGLAALPHAAPWFGLAALAAGAALNVLRDIAPRPLRGLVPQPAAVGVVFLTGANVAVDVAVGAAARVAWHLRYPRSAEAYALVVGCALIAGEGLWGLGQGLLAAFGVQPPICMEFRPAP